MELEEVIHGALREALLADFGPVVLDGMDELAGGQAGELVDGADQGVDVFAEGGEALEPLEELDERGEVASGCVDRVVAGRGQGAVLVMFRLAVVEAGPVLERRDVHADLHCLGPGQVAAVGDDPVEQFDAQPVQELSEDLRDDDGVDVV